LGNILKNPKEKGVQEKPDQIKPRKMPFERMYFQTASNKELEAIENQMNLMKPCNFTLR